MASTIELNSLSVGISGEDVFSYSEHLNLTSLSVQILADVDVVENYNCKQLGTKQGHYLSRETSAGVFASAYKLDINPKALSSVQPIWDTATGGTIKTKLTAQELGDAILTSADITGAYVDAVAPEDDNTNYSVIAVNTPVDIIIPTYSCEKP